MTEENPFLTPAGRIDRPPSGEGRSVEVSQAIDWFRRGWQAFARDPGMWLAITVVFLVIFLVMSFVPFIGSIAAMLLGPVFIGGMMLGCRAAAGGGELRLDYLFAGFKQATQPLIMVGVYYLIAWVLVMVVVFLVVGGGALTGALVGHASGAGIAAGGFVFAMLLSLALSVPIAMAVWFAPALVALRGDAPLDALKRSFSACLRNIGPFLVFGLIALVAGIVATIPFGLGLLVLLPVFLAAVHASYVDIFE